MFTFILKPSFFPTIEKTPFETHGLSSAASVRENPTTFQVVLSILFSRFYFYSNFDYFST